MVWSPNDGDNQSPWGSGAEATTRRDLAKVMVHLILVIMMIF